MTARLVTKLAMLCIITAPQWATQQALAQTVTDHTQSAVSQRLLNDAIAALSAELRDPSSLQLKKLWSPSQDVVCGLYNAKNAFGGYVGFAPFGYRSGAQSAMRLTANFTLGSDLVRDDDAFRRAQDEWLTTSFLEGSGCLRPGAADKLHKQIINRIGRG